MTPATFQRIALSMLCIALFSISVNSQTILYVKPVASGTGDGSSWTNASADLKGLMDVAAANTQVWVAAGTYYPTTTTNRSISFIMRPGVEVYGGFQGTEATLSQRNWVANKTILSGNIGDPALGTDNSYHVVVGNSTLLDGFTLTDGLANESTALDYGGGALYNNGGAALLQNCILRNNSAVKSGGAVLARSSAWPKFVNCQFIDNYAGSYGGAIFVISARVSATNCTFTGNARNAVTGDISSNSFITNCSFFQNNGGVTVILGSLTLTNSIIWASGVAIESYGGGTVIQNTNLVNIDPLFKNAAAGDLQLQPCSPAIDAGTDALNSTTLDLNGDPRKIDLLPNSALIDIGAYELQSGKCCPPANVLYVNAAATGGNNGSSWANAYTDLQEALANTCPGITEIWVAKGTYYPTTDPANRLAAFTMRNNLAIYGGFNGTETLLTQRNWTSNETILSGDIDKDGVVNDVDNSYNVVRNETVVLNNTARLDGFTLRDGYADGSGNQRVGAALSDVNNSAVYANCTFSNNYAVLVGGAVYGYGSNSLFEKCLFAGNKSDKGGAIYLEQSHAVIQESRFDNNRGSVGGAVYAINSTVQFSASTFENNRSEYQSGGAVYLENCGNSLVSNTIFNNNVSANGGAAFILISSADVELNDCRITNNTGLGGLGGGIDITSYSSIKVQRCQFLNNSITTYGGAVLCTAFSSVLLSDCLFAGNTSTVGFGGAIAGTNYATLDIRNCTFAGNSSYLDGSSLSLSASTATINNSIFWNGNKNTFFNISSSIAISNSIVQGGFPGTNVLDIDPIFVNAAGGDYHLSPCSPAIDAGDDAVNNNTTDLDGNPRKKDLLPNAAKIDMGAYELQSGQCCPPSNVLFVNAHATGGNNGSSWANAYRSLQDALANTCPGVSEIWVAQGGYYPTNDPTDRMAAFKMRNNLAIYGGFKGDETLLSQRDWKTYITYLIGDINQDRQFDGGNSYNIVRNDEVVLDHTARLDGFFLEGGYANGSGNQGAGAAIVDVFNSAVYANCTFDRNYASLVGGAVYCFGSSSLFDNCTFRYNESAQGGGLYAEGGGVTILNNRFNNNSASAYGGAIRLFTSNTLVQGCSFNGNSATGSNGSGGIFAGATAPVTVDITDCSFNGNIATNGGALGVGGSATVNVERCNFEQNRDNLTGSGAGGAIVGFNGIINIRQSKFIGNSGGLGGAIAFNPGIPVTITNSLLSGNRSRGAGGAIAAYGSSSNRLFTINHCTFTGNEAVAGRGGAVFGSFGIIAISNSILWNNMAQASTQTADASFGSLNGSVSEFSNSIVANSGGSVNWQLPGGTDLGGNLDIDPQFVQDVDLFSLPNTTGDLHLQACSPAIDQATGFESIDLEGNARPANNGNDIGAYEYTGSLPTAFVFSCPAPVHVNSCSSDELATATGLAYAVSPTSITQQQLADAGGSLTTGTCPISSIQYFDAIDAANSTTTKTIIIRTFRVSDASAHTATCTQTLTVEDNTPPTITCPAAVTVACAGDVPAADISLVTASDGCSAVTVTHIGDVISNQTCPNRFTLTRTYQAIDAAGNSATCTQVITVADNTPPTITGLTPSQSSLWPANHKMRDITLSYTATDNCAGAVSIKVSIGSSEKENSTGDGDTGPDYEVIDATHIRLRAERDGSGPGRVYTIIVTATDACGNSTFTSTQVVVAHNISAPISGRAFKMGSTVSFAGTFWDIPGNSHSARWVIDDNTSTNGSIGSEPTITENGTVSGSYKFNNPGVYKLRMEITDQNGNLSYANTAGELDAIVVIYDPNGGNTYGGGSFKSPAGAYPANPQLKGEISYGFQNNYFKTAAKPRGETQMRFELGDFEFNAVNFDYLVVDKYKAQLSGYGKITNGQSGVAFTMTVIDGQVKGGGGTDLIRLKVYNKNTGEIYYDNQPGASDADQPVTPVTAGSTIVISDEKSGPAKAAAEQYTDALQIKVGNNPATDGQSFRLQVLSSDKQSPVSLRVVDATGKTINTWQGLRPGAVVETSGNWSKGFYIAEAFQNNNRVLVKLLKQ